MRQADNRTEPTASAYLQPTSNTSTAPPFPCAADDHQRKNAEALAKAGASITVLQQDATGERIAQEIGALVENPERVTRMEEAALKLARGDAAVAAVELIESLVGRRQ